MKFLALILMGVSLLSGQKLQRVGEIRLPKGAGEIIAVDGKRKVLVTTRHGWRARGVEFVDLSDLNESKLLGHLSLKNVIPEGIEGVSSVAVDPLSRGFGAAAVIPKHPTRRRGAVVFFSLRTRSVMGVIAAGYHPDCVAFSPDGRFLTVACEGEYQRGKENTPGSLTVYEIPRNLAFEKIRPVDVPLLTKKGVRLLTGHVHDIEPEYITIQEDRAYVTLQENNAVGIFDLRKKQWLGVRPLGSWPVRMDVSDRDGPWGKRKVQVTSRIEALPLPDTLSSFRWQGRTYLATANEGDKEGFVRVKHLGKKSPKLDPGYRAELKKQYGVDPQHDSALGRLQVSPIDGDLDGDGDLDRLTTLGTRSFSIWDAASGKRIYDSASFFADFAQSDQGTFNVNNGRVAEWDTRSDNRGAEPEAIYTAIVGGKPLLLVASERQNGVYLFDCSVPKKPRLLSAQNEMREGHFSPESALILPAEKSPTGRALGLIGWEGSNSVTLYELAR
jgi:hypothetical protein